MKTILMSINKEPFDALINGSKLHEFRRKYYLNEPCQVVFYVTTPVKAICGVGLFDKPIIGDIKKIINIRKTHNFSSDENIRDYMKGLEKGYAIPILKIKRINKPISLDELRENIKEFYPPQSYYNFSFGRFKDLIERLELYESQEE